MGSRFGQLAMAHHNPRSRLVHLGHKLLARTHYLSSETCRRENRSRSGFLSFSSLVSGRRLKLYGPLSMSGSNVGGSDRGTGSQCLSFGL